MSGINEQMPSSEEAWPLVMKDLNQDLAANDPEALLAANDGFDDPGNYSVDSESLKPKPHTPKPSGIAKQVEEA